jgi:hypothetical protein
MRRLLAADPDLGAVGDAEQEIAATAARLGQAGAWDATGFAAGDARRDGHAERSTIGAGDDFGATLRRAFGADSEIAAQV